jgi:hypothetical protein
MAKILFILFGVGLVSWGIHRMKTDDGLFGKSQKSKNIFNLLLMGEASGLGQFLGGVLCIIIGITSFIIK